MRSVRRYRRAQAGFTLLELLMVIAVLGLVGGMFTYTMMRSLKRGELRDAAYQMVTDLRRTRANAQKTGLASTLTLSAGQTTYTTQTVGSAPVNYTLPHAVKAVAARGGLSVRYQPPFGTIDTTGNIWALQNAMGMTLYVKVVGLTGKVMLSETEN